MPFSTPSALKIEFVATLAKAWGNRKQPTYSHGLRDRGYAVMETWIFSSFLESIILNDPDAFLRQEVESASPAKLRWLLIRKAIGLCQAVDQLWNDARIDDASQWLLRVRDIFGELLDGVTDPKNDAARPVADIYIFLLAMLESLEKSRDQQALHTMIEILEIDLGTWELFVQRENQDSGFHVESPPQPNPHRDTIDFSNSAEWSGLNVEA